MDLIIKITYPSYVTKHVLNKIQWFYLPWFEALMHVVSLFELPQLTCVVLDAYFAENKPC